MGERIIKSPNSLVRYNHPVVVLEKEKPSTTHKKGPISGQPKRRESSSLAGISKETEEILNYILPPREWEESGVKSRQKVSSEPATRLDVLKLTEQLDLRLHQRQARETGICSVRRELFSQCFDEVIRQVTINCAERGVLLLRVRDEMQMTMAAYLTLYESSIAFGIRKAIQAEEGKDEMKDEMEKLKCEKLKLEEEIEELKIRAEQTERRTTELRLTEQKKHAHEIEFLKKTNQQLKAQLEGIIAPKK